MSEETNVEPTEPTDPQETTSNSAVRESNLFKSMAAEVTRQKAKVAEMEQADADRLKAKEVKGLEDEQKYKEALKQLTSDYDAKLSAKDAELANHIALIEHKDITHKLLSSGAAGDKACDFLASQYKAIEGDDKPDLETWINTIKENPEFSPFFSSKESINVSPDVGGTISHKTKDIELDQNMSAAEMLEHLLKN